MTTRKKPLYSVIQKYVGVLLALTFVLLLVDSMFLYGLKTPVGLVAFMTQAHVYLGYALCVLIPAFFLPHFVGHRRHSNSRAKYVGLALLAAVCTGCVFGMMLHMQGRSAATLWLIRAHEVAFLTAIAAFLAHRMAAYITPVLRFEFASVAAVVLLLVTVLALNRTSKQAQTVRGYGEPAAEATEAKPVSFGASRAITKSGHWLGEDDLRNPQYCAQCHSEIAQQWDGSLHRFASQNDPFYNATLQVLQRHKDMEPVKFCGGCHDPLILLTGNFESKVGLHSVNAEEGITCLACHAVQQVRDKLGNGGYILDTPEHYPFFGSNDPDEQEKNRQLIRAKPELHKATFLKPFHREAEFCLTCHKTHLPTMLNGYRWKRGPNDFDPWFDSSAGMQSALTFYNGEKQQRCQDCHMPDVPTNDPAARDGYTRDHTFPAANTAMAMLKNKPEWFRKTEAILKDCIRVEVFSAIHEAEDGRETRIYPLEHEDVQVVPGSTLRAEVVVRNLKVGHLFPTGTLDLNECFVQFEVGEEGSTKPVLANGMLDETGRLDPSAHRLMLVLLTREGRLVDIHNVEEVYTVLYNNAIPLGQSDVVRYEFQVPELAEGKRLRLTARVIYRKFTRQYTEFALGPDAPQLPMTVMAEDTVHLRLGPELRAPDETALSGEEFAYRLNDYGIAHLRQGDTRTARWAFGRVAELMPDYVDAYVNLARTHLQDGALDLLEQALVKADDVQPGYHKTAYFLGRLRATQSRFEEAIAAYDVTLAKFPKDREVLNQKGTALYKLERYEDAIRVFEQVMEFDPENLAAHSVMFRCYAELGEEAKSRHHEKEYLKYRQEENERIITETYRRNDPDADREANAQHVHPVHPVLNSRWYITPADTLLSRRVAYSGALTADGNPVGLPQPMEMMEAAPAPTQ